jgi:methylation protein EvaC
LNLCLNWRADCRSQISGIEKNRWTDYELSISRADIIEDHARSSPRIGVLMSAVKNCRVCGSVHLKECLNLGDMPLAGGFLQSAENIANEKRYPLPIHVCDDCGLVQILDPVDPDVLFKDYAFSSSTIGSLVNHFEDYARWLHARLDPKLVIEFGCNDGILLAPLERLGIAAIGIDISNNITDMARAKGLKALTGYFDVPMAERIVAEHGRCDVVTGSNAFAHNAEPHLILEAAFRCLKDDGVLALEVMYAGDLRDKLQWDTLYHEHLTFYSLGTIERLLNRYGFQVFDAVRIPMHGGSLRLCARRNASSPSTDYQAVKSYEIDTKLNAPETWLEFGSHIGRKIEIVANTLGRLSKTSDIWAYGAAGKATLWLNACNLHFLGAIVDESPLRAGRLMPGTHTPIVFPDQLKANAPDYIFVTAWNYADVIRAKEAWFKGTWVTPLPDMRFF